MSKDSSPHPTAAVRRPVASGFTIVVGTTIPDRAEIVRTHCREGSIVELRRLGHGRHNGPKAETAISVWLQCPSLLGLVLVRKKIGYVPVETAEQWVPVMDESATRVARGIVRTVYAPVGRDEAVLTVEIAAPAQKSTQLASGAH